MSALKTVIADLREKRLWPVAVALIAALVAVPVLLSHGAPSTTVASAPQAAATIASANAIPAVSVSLTPSTARLNGAARDPFAQRKVPSVATGTARAASIAPASGSAGSTGPKTSTKAGGTGTGTTPNATTPRPPGVTTPRPPVVTPPPPPTGLTATQSYRLTVAITKSSGGLDTIDPLQRLSVLPSRREPLLIELGVLQGGHRVLYVVQPGTVVSGPGRCTPGPVDCELLALARNQTERLLKQSPTGNVSVAEFAVTNIAADKHSSAAAADKARRTVSVAGRDLLRASRFSALSLFEYKPSLGAVVDLRNLTVGGH